MSDVLSRSLRLVFDATGVLGERARACEADVFREWFGNTAEQLEAEYARYEDSSVFVVVADEQDEVHGAMRLIRPGATGLKALHDIARAPWSVDPAAALAGAGLDPATTWEIASLGVRREARARGRGPFDALLYAVLAGMPANGADAVVAILDDSVNRVVAASGLTMRPLPGTGSAEYLGSPASTPVYASRATVAREVVAPDVYRRTRLGIDIPGVTVPEAGAMRSGRLIDLTATQAPPQIDLTAADSVVDDR